VNKIHTITAVTLHCYKSIKNATYYLPLSSNSRRNCDQKRTKWFATKRTTLQPHNTGIITWLRLI